MSALHDYHELRRRLTRSATRVLLHERRDAPRRVENVARTNIRRVLVCRPNHRLGNLLLLTPLLTELGRVLPGAEVDIVLAGADNGALFRTFGNVGHVYTLSRRMVRHPLQTARIVARIRHAGYDLAINPCKGSQSSRWLAAIARASCTVDASAGVPADAAAGVAPTHMAKWPVYLLRCALARHGTAPGDDYPVLDVKLAPAERLRGQQILGALMARWGAPYGVIGVFGDATGKKRYSEAWWVRFIDALRTRCPRFAVIEIAPPDGRSRLASRLPRFFSPDVREVAAVVSRLSCFISADCGVMHLACASGVPTVGLFQATDVTKYAPYGHGNCGIDTHGKSPEEIAQRAADAVRATLGARALALNLRGVG